MKSDRPADYLASLVRELCALSCETEWVEFKLNDGEPRAIGEYISALANAAALVGKAFAYLVWGVRDDDHAVVGTTFDHRASVVGNEELENWLRRLLELKIDFRCLRYVTRQPMTNASLRERLGIDDRNIATASRILGETVESGLIAIADPDAGTCSRSYLPVWAASRPARTEVV